AQADSSRRSQTGRFPWQIVFGGETSASGNTMARSRAAAGRDSIVHALEQRHGHDIRRAALRPRPPLVPRTPGDGDDRSRPGGPDRGLPPAPAWVRAWNRIGYGIFPGARQAFEAL